MKHSRGSAWVGSLSALAGSVVLFSAVAAQAHDCPSTPAAAAVGEETATSDTAPSTEAVPAAARKPNPYPTLPETTTAERKPNPYPTLTHAEPGNGGNEGNGDRLRTSQWVVGGVGAAALAGGVIAALVAHGRSSESKTLAGEGKFLAAHNASESAKPMRVTSYVLFGAAGAAALLDGILLWKGASASSRSDQRSAVSLSWCSGGAGIVTSGRF
jgi:hypothetical protein